MDEEDNETKDSQAHNGSWDVLTNILDARHPLCFHMMLALRRRGEEIHRSDYLSGAAHRRRIYGLRLPDTASTATVP